MILFSGTTVAPPWCHIQSYIYILKWTNERSQLCLVLLIWGYVTGLCVRHRNSWAFLHRLAIRMEEIWEIPTPGSCCVCCCLVIYLRTYGSLLLHVTASVALAPTNLFLTLNKWHNCDTRLRLMRCHQSTLSVQTGLKYPLVRERLIERAARLALIHRFGWDDGMWAAACHRQLSPVIIDLWLCM